MALHTHWSHLKSVPGRQAEAVFSAYRYIVLHFATQGLISGKMFTIYPHEKSTIRLNG
jgi:hypothetical protein